MTVHALYSKASIKGHPIHPMLVGFPIAFYTAGLASLIAYAAMGDPFWYRAAMTLWFAGAGMAVLAAIFGTIDLFAGIPRSERATRSTGVKHFGLNLLTTVLFAAGAFSMLASWRSARVEENVRLDLPLVLGAIGLGITVVAGVLGWKLVQTHHVGIDDTASKLHESRP